MSSWVLSPLMQFLEGVTARLETKVEEESVASQERSSCFPDDTWGITLRLVVAHEESAGSTDDYGSFH